LDSYFLFEEGKSHKTTVLTGYTKCGIVEEFTKRSLSYDSDVYNAIYGVLSSWSKAEPSNTVGHICGVPFEENGLLLAWESNDPTPTPRREGFPTWSWLSRKGSISWFSWASSLASVSVQKRSDVDFEATPEREDMPPEGLWVSIAGCSNRSELRTQPAVIDNNPRLIRISGWCPRVRMGRQSVDPSQYVKPSECTIKKLDGRLRFDSREDWVSIDRHDLTHTEWESCVTVLIGSTGDSHDSPLTLQNELQELSFLILCPTSEKDVYERVGIFHVELEHTYFEGSYQSDGETPDWDRDRSYYGNTIEELNSIDDLPIVGLTMTHNMHQGLCRTQEDEPDDYDLGNDFHRFTEEPNEDFEDVLVFSSDFPDWETRVFIVR
jgi:hypothetical protein